MGDFHFLHPWALLGALPLGLVLWGLWRAPGGAGSWRRVVDPHLLPHLVTPTRASLRLPLALTGLAWLTAVLALAGPTWSRAPAVRFATPLPPLVFVLDLSGSMEAQDVGSSRLALAGARLAQLIERLPPRVYAVVGFAGSGHVLLPPTDDPNLVMALLPQLGSDLLPVKGSAAHAGLEQARELLRRAEAAAADVLLVADAAEPAAADVARRIEAAGARVSVLAVGTARGTIEDGIGVPVGETGLRAVAAAGAGAYVDARQDVMALAETLSARHAPGGPTEETPERVVWRDRGPLLVLALLPLAALAFRRGWLGMLAALWLVHAGPAEAWEWSDLWLRPEQRAQFLLDRGDGLAAAELFNDPMRRGAALYRGGDFSGAADAFAQAEGADAHYNRGNALVQMGRLVEARDAYGLALALQPNHGDARFNLSLLDQRIGPRNGERRQSAPYRDERETPDAPKPSDQPPPERLELPGRSDRASGLQAERPGADGSGGSGSGGGRESAGSAAADGSGEGAGERPGDGAAQAQGDRNSGREASGDDARGALRPDAGEPGQTGEADSGKMEAGFSPQGRGESSTSQPGEDGPSTGGPEGAREAGQNAPSGATGSGPSVAQDDGEYQQALEQWLERIPDQPTRLLRELFRRQSERARRPAVEGPPW